MKRTKKVILSAVLTTGLCLSLIAGSTFALFSSKSEVNLASGSATLDVKATPTSIKGISTVYNEETGEYEEQKNEMVENGGSFATKGIWQWDETTGTISLQRMAPGDGIEFELEIENNSDITIKYRTEVTITERGTNEEHPEKQLANILEVTFGEDDKRVVGANSLIATDWSETVDLGEDIPNQHVKVMFPYTEEDQNEYQKQTLKFAVGVFVAQSTARLENISADLVIRNAEDFKTFATSVKAGNDYAGKTVELISDVDLSGEDVRGFMPLALDEWTPIGDSAHAFRGTFEGNNHTISNLNYTGEAAALFGATDGATIQNVKIKGANVTATDGGKAGILVAEAKGELTIINVTIESSSVQAAEDATEASVGVLVGSSEGTVEASAVEVQTENNSALVGSIPFGGLTTENVTFEGETGKKEDITCPETGAHDYDPDSGICVKCGEHHPFVLTSEYSGPYFDDGEIIGYPEMETLAIPGKINGWPTKLDSRLFNNNTKVKHVILCEGFTTIQDNIFSYNTYTRKDTGLQTITLPSTITTIEAEAFLGTSARIIFPEKMSGELTIGGEAFKNCSRLDPFTLPEGLKSIGNEAFYGADIEGSLVIPSTCTSIGEEAFYNIDELTVLTFAEGCKIKYIDDSTFASCNSLKTIVNFPSTVTSIGREAFSGCSLTEIALPEGLKTIGESAFSGNNFKEIVIPASVTTLGNYCFEDCYDLYKIQFGSETAQSQLKPSNGKVARGAFSGCTKLEFIWYYGTKANWESTFANVDWSQPTTTKGYIKVVCYPTGNPNGESFDITNFEE